MQINTEFAPSIWRSGYYKDSVDAHVWDPTEFEYKPDDASVKLYDNNKNAIRRFNILLVNQGGGAGGCNGKHNDCMYDVIAFGFGGKNYLPWSKPSGLKNYLNIDRDDLVKLTHVPILEEKLNCALDVKDKEGNLLYESPKVNGTKKITTILDKNHYKYDAASSRAIKKS